MARRPRVALLIESSRAYGRGLLQGIARYIKIHGPWSVDLQERELGDAIPSWLHDWEGDGIITRVEAPQIEQVILRSGLPAVDLRGLRRMKMPLIETDDQAVVHLALDHFRERGFRNFAYCGFAGANYSERRLAYFQAEISAAGGELLVYQSSPRRRAAGTMQREQSGLRYDEKLIAWIEQLPKPVGLMACNDIRAQQVLNACRRMGVNVPDEIAVIGVDNDELLCDLSSPPLSSVEPDTTKIGFEAAALLDRMMDGVAPPADPIFVAPLRVVTRNSTDVLAIDDPLVAEALRLIRQRALEPLTVERLLDVLSVSRSVLERRFKVHLNRTPKSEILRVQLNRVKELLAMTDLPLTAIAPKAGFAHAEHLSTLFKLKTGSTPGDFRESSHSRSRSD